jgi:hypothetical protein
MDILCARVGLNIGLCRVRYMIVHHKYVQGDSEIKFIVNLMDYS